MADPANWRDGGGTFDAAPRPDRSTRQGESYALYDARRRAHQDKLAKLHAEGYAYEGYRMRSWTAPPSHGALVETVPSKKGDRSPWGHPWVLEVYRTADGVERLERRVLITLENIG